MWKYWLVCEFFFHTCGGPLNYKNNGFFSVVYFFFLVCKVLLFVVTIVCIFLGFVEYKYEYNIVRPIELKLQCVTHCFIIIIGELSRLNLYKARLYNFWLIHKEINDKNLIYQSTSCNYYDNYILIGMN